MTTAAKKSNMGMDLLESPSLFSRRGAEALRKASSAPRLLSFPLCGSASLRDISSVFLPRSYYIQ
jgi:hypothetical protein